MGQKWASVEPVTAVAALLMALTFFVHVFAGGPEVYTPLRHAGLSAVLTAFSSVLWHMVSVTLAVLALALAVLSVRPDPVFETLLSGLQLAYAALFIAYGFVDLGSLWPMPQWIVFLIIPVLTFLGQRRARRG